MLGVEIEFGNNQTPLETSSYKPTKAKTPARWQGFFQFQMVARGGIDQGLRMSDPNFDFLLGTVQKNLFFDELTERHRFLRSQLNRQLEKEILLMAKF